MPKFLRPSEYPVPSGYEVSGTTMTLPNLAPSLAEIIAMNLKGQPLPMVGKPLFDDSEAAGEARVKSNVPLCDIYDVAQSQIDLNSNSSEIGSKSVEDVAKHKDDTDVNPVSEN